MPYIDKKRRSEIDNLIDFTKASETELAVGDLNYLITRLLLTQVKKVSYTQGNNLIGVLECAKLEMYRRMLAGYEDSKILQNGDVYE